MRRPVVLSVLNLFLVYTNVFMEISKLFAKSHFMTFLSILKISFVDLCIYFCPWMSAKSMHNTSDVESVHQNEETAKMIRTLVAARGSDGATLRTIKRELICYF